MSSSRLETRWEATTDNRGGSGRRDGSSAFSRGYSHGRDRRDSGPAAEERGGGNNNRKRQHRGYQEDDDDERHHHRRSRHSDHHRRSQNYYRRADDVRGDDWKCYECSTWNDPRDSRCRRCGRFFEPEERPRRTEFGRGYDDVSERRRGHEKNQEDAEEQLDEFGRPRRSPRQAEEEEQDEVDEFGRPIMRTKGRNDKEKSEDKSGEKGPTWPPPFNKRSTTYEFDTRSGMFYHAPSNFFYDPKSKLYFGHKTQQYYQYDAEQVPPFKQVKQEKEEDDGNKALAESAGESKPKIAIALKTKSFDGKKSSKKANKRKEEPAVKQVKLAPVVTQTELTTQQNLNRWSGRQQEVAATDVGDDGKTETVTTSKIYRTKTDNKPICLLCRRKFRDVDHWRRHEEKSEMHKTNVERKKSKTASKQPSNNNNSSLYRDRAMERRILHGPMDVVPTTADESVVDTVAVDAPPSNPEQALDASNVGHQMLQKLGWKADEDTKGSNDHLKKDWKRIEALASSQQRHG